MGVAVTLVVLGSAVAVGVLRPNLVRAQSLDTNVNTVPPICSSPVCTDPAHPLAVVAAGDGVPYQVELTAHGDALELPGGFTGQIPIPIGKVFVIEQVSGMTTGGRDTQFALSFSMTPGSGLPAATHFVPTSGDEYRVSGTSLIISHFNHLTRMYATDDPVAGPMTWNAEQNGFEGVGSTSILITVVGRLVPL
ncbi:MAG: hypothetical protein ACLP1X_21330 [Polyangiaceae bacterium]